MFRDPWPADRSWVKTIAGFSIPVLLTGALGYSYLTTATPVTANDALRLYRSARTASPDRAVDREPRHSRADASGARPGARPGTVASGRRPTSRRLPRQGRGAAVVAAAARPRTPASESHSQRPDRDPVFTPGAPKEGVYSWETEGYESFNGSRRSFPRETQRIVTRTGRTSWTLHHYFSKERESWSQVSTDRHGYSISSQRNKVVFGPVTRETTVTFRPPMVTGPMPPRVGERWEGTWEGKTYGSYAAHYFEKTTIEVEGRKVEVWALELEMELHGETEGSVWAQVWVSPRHHLVVREHYRQDVTSGPGSYRAEWLMTVRSLAPRR